MPPRSPVPFWTQLVAFPARAARPLRVLAWMLTGFLLAWLGVGMVYVYHLDQELRAHFAGLRWAVPARVFARPQEWYVGSPLHVEGLLRELEALGYRVGDSGPGQYRLAREAGELRVWTRGFPFSDGLEPERRVRVRWTQEWVTALQDMATGADLDLVRLEPLLIGSLHPLHGEDRILLSWPEIPPALLTALIVTEDRRFLAHRGVDPLGMLRALIANLRAGRTVQGGSTLTQQLVKNIYLTRAQTLHRKLQEAVLAILLEYRFSKEAILEAYVNEVFLGQSGGRAIHGFGLAAEFYYRRPLEELRLDQLALLVGLARGASHYDPRRHPERALARRDWVLERLRAEEGVAQALVDAALQQPLDVVPRPATTAGGMPAFMDLVWRQLRAQYREEDLRSEGLRVFTTLDPGMQWALERSVQDGVSALEREAGRSLTVPVGTLQAAAILLDPRSGEIRALVGGRDPHFPGFNRALDARRSIGSLIKPFVFLAALSDPSRFTLATLLDDDPLHLRLSATEVWSPRNFDRRFHGQVTAWQALVQSYNVSTVRLAQQVGIGQVIRLLQTLGLEASPVPAPSLALGALELSVLEVATLYQSLANGGYATQPRVIRAVLDAEHRPLSHGAVQLRGAVPDAAVQLVQHALQGVTQQGTARRIARDWPERRVAGKTGTSNDLRDSWFAGFDARHLAVVWVGHDQNLPVGLTGSSGALPLWLRLMQQLPGESLPPVRHPEIRRQWIDLQTGLRVDTTACAQRLELPFWKDSIPRRRPDCDLQVPVFP
jgi:penicillin-binding protein 1B